MIKKLKKTNIKLSNYVKVSEKTFKYGSTKKKYHSFSQTDYVSLLAITKKNKVVLVKQYRPAIEKFTIELPGGLRDKNELPKSTAVRELFEETGYRAKKLKFLGSFAPDSGRLENKIFCFFTKNVIFDKNHKDEKYVKSFEVSLKVLEKLIKKNKIQHFLHVGIIGLAYIRGLFKFK